MIKNRTAQTLLFGSILALGLLLVAFFAVAVPAHAASAQGNVNASTPFQSNISQKVGKLAHYS